MAEDLGPDPSILYTYLSEEELIEEEPGGFNTTFKYRPFELREPNGWMDFCLQVLIDLGTEGMFGGEGELKLDSREHDFNYSACYRSDITLEELTDSIVNIYGYDADKFEENDPFGDNRPLSKALGLCMELSDREAPKRSSFSAFKGMEEHEVTNIVHKLERFERKTWRSTNH